MDEKNITVTFLQRVLYSLVLLFLTIYFALMLFRFQDWNIFTACMVLSFCVSSVLSLIIIPLNNSKYHMFFVLRLLFYTGAFVLMRVYVNGHKVQSLDGIPHFNLLVMDFLFWVVLANVLFTLINRYGNTLIAGLTQADNPRLLMVFLRCIINIIFVIAFLFIDVSLNLKIVVTYSTAVTGLLTIVVGVYFKEVLSSFFQGLMLSVHAPFVVGDVVRVRASGVNWHGFVVDFGWRSTQLKTFQGEVISVPNYMMANNVIVNETCVEDQVKKDSYKVRKRIIVHPDHDPGWVRLLLVDAIMMTKPVGDSVEFTNPFVLLIDYNERGAEFVLSFNTEREKAWTQSSDVLMNVYRVLTDAGVRVSAGTMHTLLEAESGLTSQGGCADTIKSEVDCGLRKFGSVEYFSNKATYPDHITNRQLILSCELFESLSGSGVDLLVQSATRMNFEIGRRIINVNEHSPGVYIIRNGAVGVYYQDAELAVVSAGHVFGEMSALTVDALSSCVVMAKTNLTVLFLSSDIVNKVMQSHPLLKESWLALVKRRNKMNRDMLTKISKKVDAEQYSSFSTFIARFFVL